MKILFSQWKKKNFFLRWKKIHNIIFFLPIKHFFSKMNTYFIYNWTILFPFLRLIGWKQKEVGRANAYAFFS